MRRLVALAFAVVLGMLVVYLLFTTVFPWVDRTFVTDPVIEGSGAPWTLAWSAGGLPAFTLGGISR